LNKPKVNPGELDKEITITGAPSATASPNAYGEPGASGASVGTGIWAKIEAMNGGESFEANKVIARATHKITIRYLSGVTPGCSITYSGRTFFVGYVGNPRENNWLMELICEEKVTP
jgi:SPP1 family predicted phage head-tail adaptor